MEDIVYQGQHMSVKVTGTFAGLPDVTLGKLTLNSLAHGRISSNFKSVICKLVVE